MVKLASYLKKIYFDPGHPASFSGPRKVYNLVRKAGYSPSFRYIKQWVQDQEAYSIHKPVRRKFQRNRVVVSGKDILWDADLGDMQDVAADNDNYRFFLLIIDVFSKFIWVRPLLNKTAKATKEAVEDVISQGRVCKKFRTDKGGEFNSNVLKTYLKSIGVHYYTSQNESKANYSERCIKSIKVKLIRYMTHNNTRRYIDVLQDIVKSYNNTVHRTTGMKPVDITDAIAKRLWWKIYKPKGKPKKKPAYTFSLGDTVRISFLKDKFSREYDQTFTGEYFTIIDRYRRSGIPVYELEDYNKEPIKGKTKFQTAILS